jgi:hypothetical protein
VSGQGQAKQQCGDHFDLFLPWRDMAAFMGSVKEFLHLGVGRLLLVLCGFFIT